MNSSRKRTGIGFCLCAVIVSLFLGMPVNGEMSAEENCAEKLEREFQPIDAAEHQDLQNCEDEDLHSMQAGDLEDEIPVPLWVLVVAGLVLLIILL